MRITIHLAMGALMLCCAQIASATQYVLGNADAISIDQPTISAQFINPRTGNTDGPADPDYPMYMLLDTGANGILLAAGAYTVPDPDTFGLTGTVDPDIYDRATRGDGSFVQYNETGVAGNSTYDILDTYQIRFGALADDAVTVSQWFEIPQINHAMGDSTFELQDYSGIMGMPAMVNHVVTLGLSHMLVDNPLLGGPSSMSLMFSDTMPTATPTSFDIPLTMVSFDPVGKVQPTDPDPTYAPLPFVDNVTVSQNTGPASTGSFLIDTGAQTSIISWETFDALGLVIDENTQYLDVGGVGGTVSAPIVLIDRLELPTTNGDTLVLTNLEALVLDIPGINGVLGMSVLSSGYYDQIMYNLYMSLGDLLDPDTIAALLEGMDPNAQGLFDNVVFDFTQASSGTGIMRLDVNSQVIPEPMTLTLALPAIAAFLLGRRKHTMPAGD